MGKRELRQLLVWSDKIYDLHETNMGKNRTNTQGKMIMLVMMMMMLVARQEVNVHESMTVYFCIFWVPYDSSIRSKYFCICLLVF